MSRLDHIRQLVQIKDRDPDSMTHQDYDHRNALAEKLFGTVSIHDAFSHRYPEFCLSTVVSMSQHGQVKDLREDPSTRIYSQDGRIGGAINVYPNHHNLAQCLSDAQTEPNGVYLYFDDHSNVVWLDNQTKEIHRYDPQVSGQDSEAPPIDGAMKKFFSTILPDYTYLGNTLTPPECIQDVRYRERGHLDCFCQEYTLLYAWNRLSGMSHQEAAHDLVTSKDKILDRIADFYDFMGVE